MEFNDIDTMVRARVGSMLPDNRAYVEDKILSLAQAGLIQDPEYILENMQLPGIERLINKQTEKQNSQQMDPSMFEGMSEDEIFQQLQSNPQLAQNIKGVGNEPGMD